MSARTKVIVAGCVCIDISPEFRCGRVAEIGDLLKPGKLIEAGKATVSPGGAVSNTGLALKALGEDNEFVKEGIVSRKTVEYLEEKAVKTEPKAEEKAEEEKKDEE